jgi:hypothetical protein
MKTGKTSDIITRTTSTKNENNCIYKVGTLFSCTEGNSLFHIAQYGIKTLVGAWLGDDQKSMNEK